jgi:hypothetical protein
MHGGTRRPVQCRLCHWNQLGTRVWDGGVWCSTPLPPPHTHSSPHVQVVPYIRLQRRFCKWSPSSFTTAEWHRMVEILKLLVPSWQVKRERKRGGRKTGRRGVGGGVVEWGGNRRGLRTEREGFGGGWWVNGE